MRNQTYLSCYRKIIVLLVLFSLVASSSELIAQISTLKASYKGVTNYTTSANDPIYVFCDQSGVGVGELKASSGDGSLGWSFTWTKWDVGSGSFSISVPSTDSATESILTNLTDGLYKVEASNGVDSFEDQAWVINNTNNSTLTFDLMDCEGVHFTSSFTPVDLKYNDIDDVPNLKSVILQTEAKIINFSLQSGASEIRTASENLFVPPFNTVTKIFSDKNAFENEKSYEVVVTDQYGCEFRSNPVSSGTYVVEALFTIDKPTGEAEHTVNFTNNSLNATEYEWYLFEDNTIDEDSLLTDGILLKNDKDVFEYKYLHPGNYFVKLIAKSDKGPDVCMHEFILETPIVVDTSLVEVPNVFTPNGDGKNDTWLVKSQSLKSFHAIVFNRWGRVVYEWRNADEGWNGKVNGKWATPGTYYYVITAVGHEKKTKKYIKKGSFMLIRK